VFCGLNDELMQFREKDVDRIVSEVISLSSKYHVLNFRASDWIISRKSRETIFRKLKDLDVGIELFYETRSDMSKEEIVYQPPRQNLWVDSDFGSRGISLQGCLLRGAAIECGLKSCLPLIYT
jgi:hypothetical protein